MIATRLFHECPLIVMVTGGRLPPPSASTSSGGTSKPLMGSGGSTCDRNFIICSCSLVSSSLCGCADLPTQSGAASHRYPVRFGEDRTACPLLRVGLVLSAGAVADAPDVAVEVGERAAVPTPWLGGGGLEDRGAGLLGVCEDLVHPRFAADHVGEDHPAETAALRAGAHLGGQAVTAVKADQRAAVRSEEHRHAVVPLNRPAQTFGIK